MQDHASPIRNLPAASAEYARDYTNGWNASRRGAEGTLDRADARNVSHAWYDGYEDYAIGNAKWTKRDERLAGDHEPEPVAQPERLEDLGLVHPAWTGAAEAAPEAPEPGAGQCSAETADRACVLDSGHAGEHFDSGVSWSEPDEFATGYKAGLSDGRSGQGRDVARRTERYGDGYRLGYRWGKDHPAPSVILSCI